MAASFSADFCEALFQRRAFGIKLGLDAIEAVLEKAGHPERGLNFIHVAGTNGKGSVCAMLESVLREAGLRTGLYTSPHLICFHERIRVHGRCISDAELYDAFQAVSPHITAYEKSPAGREFTFFEYATVLALAHFQKSQPDVVVWEVGMGGRLDATNVVMPRLALITGIAMDHMAHLGKVPAAIAAEKAGILKPEVPVIMGPVSEDAGAVILNTARERHCRVLKPETYVSIRAGTQSLKGQVLQIETTDEFHGRVLLPLLGRHQVENTALALTAFSEYGRIMGIDWPPEAWKRGLESVSWPGRLQVLSENPVALVDGAHNPEAAAELAVFLKKNALKKPLGFILGMCRDKDVEGFLSAMGRQPSVCWTVPIQNERSFAPEELAQRAAAHGWRAIPCASVRNAWEAAMQWAEESSGIVCAAGSLFLVGQILEQEGWGNVLGCPKTRL